MREIILHKAYSPFQHVELIIDQDGDLALFLDGYLQFNTRWEQLYHDLLFAYSATFPKKLENILVLGGGDGLGIRELLKHPTVKSIDLVDIDPHVIDLAKYHPLMKSVNKDSFNDKRVTTHVIDAHKWLKKWSHKKYDLIIVDFPDPTDPELWELYSKKVFASIRKRLRRDGVIAIQSSEIESPSFFLIAGRVRSYWKHVIGYYSLHIGCAFIMASQDPIKTKRHMAASKPGTWKARPRLDRILKIR